MKMELAKRIQSSASRTPYMIRERDPPMNRWAILNRPLRGLETCSLRGCEKSRTPETEGALMIKCLFILTMVTTFAIAARAADQNTRLVIYDGVATEVSAAPEASSDLWITTADLSRATRFVI